MAKTPPRLRIEDETPAFPRITEIGHDRVMTERGMLLRDWFAGLAMQGMMTVGDAPQCLHIAYEAYRMADAMMARRRE